MSIGGEIMEEHYDKLIHDFLKKLEIRLEKSDDDVYFAVWNIIEEYKEHFKNNGIYEIPQEWIIEYPDGLVINLKDKDPREYEPCECVCHKHPKGEMMHIVQCCNKGWKKKKNVQDNSQSPMLGKTSEDKEGDRSYTEPRY